jgi:predicted DNA-binding protein YlxM (UPF0122 family)
VTGPIDQIQNGINGYIDEDLELAVEMSFSVSRQSVYDSVKNKSWKNSAKSFLAYVTK